MAPEQIQQKLALADRLRKAGKRVHEISRALGISDTTLYNWRRRFGQDGNSRALRLAALQAENRRLRRIIAALAQLRQRPGSPEARSG